MARQQSALLKEGRRLNDLGVALVESVYAAGGTDEDARRVFADEVLKARLGQLVMNKLHLTGPLSQLHAADLIPKDWTVLEDVEPIADLKVEELEFVGYLLELGEPYTPGVTMRSRAIDKKANFGLVDGKRILAQQEKIPVEMRSKIIVLTGTVLRDSNGALHVAYLRWRDGRWGLGFYWLEFGWGARGRLARRKQTLGS